MKSRHIDDLESALEVVARLASAPEDQLQQVRHKVSAWSASQQLDHMIRVVNATLGAILESKSLDKASGINLLGRVILRLGWIPRGRGKSPERLRGVATPSKELLDELQTARTLLARVGEDTFEPADLPVVRHPYFGDLNPEQTLRFVVVHTRHHLKIVRDINAAR